MNENIELVICNRSILLVETFMLCNDGTAVRTLSLSDWSRPAVVPVACSRQTPRTRCECAICHII